MVARRTGRFRTTWFTAWIALFVWTAVMALFVGPMIGIDSSASEYLPDGPSIVAATVVGWLPAGALAALAMILGRISGGFVINEKERGQK
jgi:uncharacterized membrane protein